MDLVSSETALPHRRQRTREVILVSFVAVVASLSAWAVERVSWNYDCRQHGFDGLYVAHWYDPRAWMAADQCVVAHGQTGLVVPRSEAWQYEQSAKRVREGGDVEAAGVAQPGNGAL